MRIAIFISSLLLIATATLTAETDSTELRDSTSIPVTFDLSGGFDYQSRTSSRYVRPAYFDDDQEFLDDIDESYPWRDERVTFTDNPLYHGAGWVRLGAVSQPIEEARLEAALIGEMRGVSYGRRDTENMIVYPEFLLTLKHDQPLLGDTLHAMIELGDFTRLESLVPLTFYNIDAQGTRLTLGYRGIEYIYEKAAGDAAMMIGLNIDEADHWMLRMRDIGIADVTTLRVQAGLFRYESRYSLEGSFAFGATNRFSADSPRDSMVDATEPGRFGVALSTQIDHRFVPSTSGSIMIDYALRSAAVSDRLMSRSAFRASAGFDVVGKQGSLSLTGTFRYYGGLFNAGYRNDDASFRQEYEEGGSGTRGAATLGYANTIGPHLYSLRQLDYPFSQWAVFTEYQDLKDVTGWTLFGQGRWRFYDRFFLDGTFDLNLIVPEGLDAELYSFFSLTAGYEPYSGITAELGVTNRTMNLDKHYPTYHLFDGIAAMGRVRWGVGW